MLQLLFKEAIRGSVGILDLDAILSETHNKTNKVTAFPVERGADITDHISTLPVEVQLEGHITDTPVATILDPKIEFGPMAGVSRSAAAYDLLKTIFESRTLITVVSGLDVYEDMAFVSLAIPRSPSTGSALNFQASFRKVRIVDSETVLIPKAAPKVSDKAATKTDAGQNQTTEAGAKSGAKAGEKAKSLLAKLLGG